ncbi:sterol desaturase family protein [Aliiroseovarius sp. S1339]|uniref:sterol desaturase family protein n=1 Tax=Aliiroseovarius sp. S1339 TaxID=2936990 RepID=UPI0020BE1E68|nr:sterol desaturase family protein [Aliiroseovarius sp. S1339]MCK8463471.1 sterol desaturase family protein [Aliiroseovarius sp. S1339]
MKATLAILVNMGSLHRLLPFWLVGVAALIYWFSPWLVLAIVYGVFAQFFVEYAMHRFLFHREPPTDQGVFNELYRSHIGHHEFPNDAEYFTGGDHWYPVRFAMISLFIHSLILWPFLGFGTAVLTAYVALFVGSVSAYTFYEYCHTLAHVNVRKGWFGQRVTRTHLAHHFQDHEATYHVSFGMNWIDRLFGTKHDPAIARERYDRDTILSLGMDPEDLRLVTARKAFGITKVPRGKLTRQQASHTQ